MVKPKQIKLEQGSALRRGWTTGACGSAATKSALSALLGQGFLDPVHIVLPGGQTPSFALHTQAEGPDFCQTGIVKDAGDDSGVTHRAEIIARAKKGSPGSGIVFIAGDGVGVVTKKGLPI